MDLPALLPWGKSLVVQYLGSSEEAPLGCRAGYKWCGLTSGPSCFHYELPIDLNPTLPTAYNLGLVSQPKDTASSICWLFFGGIAWPKVSIHSLQPCTTFGPAQNIHWDIWLMPEVPWYLVHWQCRHNTIIGPIKHDSVFYVWTLQTKSI